MDTTASKTKLGDELQRIRGIGQGIERRLHNAQIHTFADLAALNPPDLAVILKGLPGFTRESPQLKTWIEQAGELAAGQAASEMPVDSGPIEGEIYETESQTRYENFTIVLKVGVENRIERTRVMHMQDGTETAWQGWDGEQLLGFILEYGGMRDQVHRQQAQPPGEDLSAPVPPPAELLEPRPPLPAAPASDQPAMWPAPAEFSIAHLEVKNMDLPTPVYVIKSDRAFRVSLDICPLELPENPQTVFKYSAAVFARNLGTRVRHKVAAGIGKLTLADQYRIDVWGSALPAGVYRMEAMVTLMPEDTSDPQAKRTAFLDGGVFQVE